MVIAMAGCHGVWENTETVAGAANHLCLALCETAEEMMQSCNQGHACLCMCFVPGCCWLSALAGSIVICAACMAYDGESACEWHLQGRERGVMLAIGVVSCKLLTWSGATWVVPSCSIACTSSLRLRNLHW
jgi:hypothetical protein